MIRNLIAVAGAALVAGSASAAFIGIEVREDKVIDPGAAAIADPGGRGLRTFNLYAKFDAEVVPDVQNPASENTVISVGQPDAVTNWRINMDDGRNAGANFYQNLTFGTNLPPNPALIPVFPDLALDSYVGLGNKTLPPAGQPADTTSVDPDFAFGPSEVFGGWFNSGGSNFQGGADASTFNAAKGTYDVFIAQVTILGLDAGADSGEGSPLNGNAATTWRSDVFKGQMTVFTQTPGGGATPHVITFAKVPTPGTLALFGVAGLAAGRRRRA
jgi:MYXO-CTERM domain-containing protein